MENDSQIKAVDFDPKVANYWLVSGALLLVSTVFGVPLLILWIPFGLSFMQKRLKTFECVLTDKKLIVNKGAWFRSEKTIPLEKITDVSMNQGPIMRRFGLFNLAFETAGQSNPGALASITGIVEASEFRALVLKQRDALSNSNKASALSPDEAGPVSVTLLKEIRDSLSRIELEIKDKPKN